MRLLICAGFPVLAPSAGKNRLERMRSALAIHGMEAILVGEGSSPSEPWHYESTANGPCIGYNPHRVPVFGRCRAMRIGAQAAHFYRDYLTELIKTYACRGVIDFACQAQVSRSILDAARSVGAFVVGDIVERFTLSWHNLLNGMNWQQSRLCRAVLPRMDGLIGISRGWCDWAERRGIPNVWIPSFAQDHGCVRTGPSAADRPFTLAFIGHWESRELPRTIMQAILLCIDRGVDVRMNVLGNVGRTIREREAMCFFRKHPALQEHIKFLGFVSDPERDRQLAEADAFILLRPDNRETDMLFPTRLPEYLLTGNPVILSMVGSFPYCFEHRKDVWFISRENRVEEVADALLFLARNPQERWRIGQRGRQTALKDFSLEVLGQRLAGFVRSVADKHSLDKLFSPP